MTFHDKRKFSKQLVCSTFATIGLILLTYFLLNLHPWTKRQYTVGTSYMTMNNNFYVILNEQIANSVNQHGDRLITRDPALKVDKQVQQINDFIKEKVDLIVIAPVDGNSVKIHQALRKARAAGIKIINVDTEMKWADANCTIATDNYRAGSLVARYLLKKEKQAKILLLTQASAYSAKERISGFCATLSNSSKAKNYKIVDRLETFGQSEIALPKVTAYLKKGKSFDTVMALNDQAAIGALSAIAAQKLDKKIHVYSVDGSPNMKLLISKNSNAVATAAQSPVKMGKSSAKAIYGLLKGKKVKEKIVIPTEIIERGNLNHYGTTGWQ